MCQILVSFSGQARLKIILQPLLGADNRQIRSWTRQPCIPYQVKTGHTCHTPRLWAILTASVTVRNLPFPEFAQRLDLINGACYTSKMYPGRILTLIKPCKRTSSHLIFVDRSHPLASLKLPQGIKRERQFWLCTREQPATSDQHGCEVTTWDRNSDYQLPTIGGPNIAGGPRPERNQTTNPLGSHTNVFGVF